MSRYPHRILAEKHKRVQTQNSIEDKFLKQKLESFSREKLYIDRELRRISLARTSLLESLDRFNTIPKSTHKRLSLPCLIDGQGKEANPRPISSLRRHTIPSFLEGVRAVAECKQSLKPRGREDTSLQSRKGSKPTLSANGQKANFVQGLTLKSQHKDHDTRGASPNKISFTGQPYENKLNQEKKRISRQASEEEEKTRDRLQLPVLADSPAKPQLITPKIGSANALVNSLIGESRISTLGLLVVDELHMLGEAGRGATLEMCLAKVLFASSTTQIIGMSATLSNIADLKEFLKAEVYSNDFRPVELKEFVKVGCDIYKVPKASEDEEDNGKPFRRISNKQGQNKELLLRDPDQLLTLVLEVIPRHSCLVFCSTKKNCQSVALLLVKFMPREMCQVKAKERHDLMKALYNEASGLCPVLKQTIPFGVAYHHSGLTMDERKLIEDGYSQGVLSLLTCTSTLAAGVNLPAKRVIVRAPYVGSALLSQSQYKQMIGRAGRAGIDTSGESILIIKDADKPKISHLFSGPLESCRSSLLHQNGKGLRVLLLTLVGLKLCSTVDELKQFMQKTLLFVQSPAQSVDIEKELETSLESLQQLGHVIITNTAQSRNIEVTHLGQATFKGCIDVESSPVIYREVTRALVLTNELHLLYLVTPLDNRDSVEPQWMTYFKQVLSLGDSEQRVAELVGATESLLSRRATGQRVKKDDSEEASVKRFYLTLILYKLMKENTIWDVASLFNVTRGFVQNLLTSASSFASCMVHFTQELQEFWGVNLLLEAMVKKLSYTAALELVPLMEVPGVKQARARQLFKAGYKSLNSLAWADVNSLMADIAHLSRRQANQIVSAAKMLLEEKADALREEAEEMTTVPEKPNT
ncbi:helicase POLQ-like [Porites lutea]|uniref:helicase POLQ-like n=1 Tax=Porites lutea TaxID=51062 RepID=UPI003CC58914